jgi:hypothetical protein
MKFANSEIDINWLVNSDNPGVRYLAMRDLLDISDTDVELNDARKIAHNSGPIATVLDAMQPDGYWGRPGPGYTMKYFSTVWALIMLSQLGGCIDMDERIRKGCNYLLDHALTSTGQFGYNGTPSGTIDCLQGNMLTALLSLGCTDPRLDLAFEWMARSVTGEGISPNNEQNSPTRYFAYKCGPGFACGANGTKPCSWGAVKVMLGFSRLSVEKRTPLIERAINQGADFLLGTDPAKAEYPTRTDSKPSRDWWKFGFPVFYITDILQLTQAMIALGYGRDPRLSNAIILIDAKKDSLGRWPLEFNYTGKTWVDFGAKNQPNPWVSIRALKALKEINE